MNKLSTEKRAQIIGMMCEGVSLRAISRLTNAFSKKIENHAHGLAIYFMHYNFVRIHKTTRVTPAMAIGVTTKLWELTDIVRVVDEWEAQRS